MSREKRIYRLITAVEIVLFLIAVFGVLRQAAFAYPFTQFTVEQEGESSVRIRTEEVAVPKGIYAVTVEYRSDSGSDASCYAEAAETSVYSLYADNVKLSGAQREKSFYIYANDALNNLHFVATCENSGFSVQNIRVETAYHSKMHQIFCTAVKLLLINALAFIIFRKRKIFGEGAALPVTLIGLAASIGMFAEYLPYGHDLLFHLLRIDGIKDGLLSGAFPVRIQPNWNNGYGYATSVLYGDILLYFPAALRLVGVTVQNAYKAYVTAINLLTAAAAYYAFYEMSKDRRASVFVSALYTLAPWRLCCIYTRAAVGEYSAMLFLPLAALAFFYAVKNEDQKVIPVHKMLAPVIGFSGLMQTHILTCLLCVIMIAVFCVVAGRKIFRKNSFRYLASVAGSVILLNLWFLVPWFRYMREGLQGTLLDEMTIDFQKMGANLPEMFAVYWTGTLGSGWGEIRSIAAKFPKPAGAGTVLALAFAIRLLFGGRKLRDKKGLWVCTGMTALSLYMASSLFPYYDLYKVMPGVANFIAKIRIPCRFLSVAALFGAILALAVNTELKSAYGIKTANCVMAAVAAIAVLQGTQFIYANLYRGDADRYYDIASIDSTNTIGDEYFYPGTQNGLTWQEQSPVTFDALFDSFEKEYNRMTVECRTAEQDGYLELPLYYYPGYAAFDADAKLSFPVEKGNNNKIRVALPKNYAGSVTVEFREPLLWKAAKIISLLFAICAMIYLCAERKGRGREQNICRKQNHAG